MVSSLGLLQQQHVNSAWLGCQEPAAPRDMHGEPPGQRVPLGAGHRLDSRGSHEVEDSDDVSHVT